MKRVYILTIAAACATVFLNMRGVGDAEGAVNLSMPSDVPVGTILAYAGEVTGQQRDRLWAAGWLPCDGTVLQESQNLPVFRVIDRYWGGDKEKREFRLPDLRGRFVRGVNHDQSQYGDPEASIRHPSADGGAAKNHVGSIQNQSFRKHRHRLNDPGHAHDVHLGKGDKNNEMAADGDHFIPRRPDMHLGTYSSLTNISMDDAGGVETRPVNVYVNWIIKLGPPQTGTAPRGQLN